MSWWEMALGMHANNNSVFDTAHSEDRPADNAATLPWSDLSCADPGPLRSSEISNHEIAQALERLAELLQAQGGNPYRVRAYRNAAQTARSLARSLADILAAEGRKGLERLPAIGKSISAAIEELVQTGGLRLLDVLEGQASSEDLFATIPGIGEALARRIHDVLHVDTLEELEVAAHDGRLGRVPGFGPRRVQSVRSHLDVVLSHSARRRAWAHRHRQLRLGVDYGAPRPSVATLLAVDEEYRRLAQTDQLERIAPRRFNPAGHAWLPMWHTERDGWHFTVLYSNTARAHELGKTRDWVVIFYEKDGEEDQCTVVTEYHGALTGRRVVRGRERACASYHDHEQQQEPAEEVRRWVHALAEGEPLSG